MKLKTLFTIGLIISIGMAILSVILGDLSGEVTWLLVSILISLEKSQLKR